MAYKVIILYRLYMPSYFLGTFTEYPIHSHIGQGNQSDDLTLLAIKYKGIPGSK